jgi:hypothetical protein
VTRAFIFEQSGEASAIPGQGWRGALNLKWQRTGNDFTPVRATTKDWLKHTKCMVVLASTPTGVIESCVIYQQATVESLNYKLYQRFIMTLWQRTLLEER